MRGYYKRRIDELRAPSLTTNRPPSVSKLIPDRKTINMLKGRLRKPGTPGSVPSKEDPRDVDATVVDKPPKQEDPKPRTPAGPALPPGPEKKETPRLRAKPETSVGEPERRVSRQRREEPTPKAEGPSRTQSKAEEPTRQQARPEDQPTQDPARPKRKISSAAEASLRRKAKMEGPEGESARAAMKRLGLEESLRRLGRLIVGLL